MEKVTIQACHEELVRLLRILFYSKVSEKDKDIILQSVKCTLESLAKCEKKKQEEAERRRADREARKLGMRRQKCK